MSLVSTLGQWPPPPGATSDLSAWAQKFQKSTQARCEELAKRINSEFIVGTFAQRPASIGIPRIYFATDTGISYLDSPSGWVALGGDPTFGSYSPGSFAIPTNKYVIMAKQLILTGAQRLTIADTGRLVIV